MSSLGAFVGGPLGEEDVEELRSERSIRGLKSQEEIERLTVDESLDDIERAVLLLSSGVEIQKLSIINNLPKLLEKNNADVNRRVVPVLRDYLYIAPLHVQLEATKSFSSIIQNGTIPAYMFSSSFLPIILHNLDNRDTVVSNAWLETLLTSIDFLPKDVIKREVLGIAISKGQLSQTVNCRLASCKLLGQIAPKFETYWIKKELMGLVASLCQDVDYEVRACMCQQLETIARALGLESTQSIIIPELVELTNDEETSVRLAGLETITNLLSLLDDDTCTAVIIPLVQKFCDEIPKQSSESLLTVARLFGKLSYGLSVNLDDSKKRWFLEFYKRMCYCGNPNKNNRVGSVTLALQSSVLSGATIDDDPEAECRRCCAFNFPAMLLFCGAPGFQAELSATFHSLVEDPHALVRRTIACGFHEVAKLLGTNVGTIQQDLSVLLKDESIEVLEGLIPNLPGSLECLASGGHSTMADTKLNNLSNLIPSLIASELAVDSSSNWRLHVQLLEKFSCFPKCLTSDQIYYKFVPLFFRLLSSNRVLPVKLAAAHTLCVFIRYNRRFEQRQELCCRLIQECGRGKSYRSRLLFIDICKFIMELFSRRFFKENFFEFLLELGSDPVLNVRLKFCTIPPRLKSLLKLPSDRHLLQQLEQCIRKLLSSEKEPDVCNAVREAFMKLDKTKYEDDKMDQQKEEEERLLIVIEEKEREELAGANKVSDPRKKGTKDDKTRKAVATKSKSKPESHVQLKRTPSNSGSSATGTAKASQKTAPQRNLGSKGSPSSSLQRLPNLSSALPATAGPSTTGSWKGSNASTPTARSSVTSSTVKTTGKTTKEKTSDKTVAGKNKKSISVSSGNSSRGGF
ncbi:serine/threonine-protein phosphatase 4 regulatory subunit 4-like isoform X2 [Orbicella faveolata]|uniref:serine/threonine-protein phosphatase 4 regulatory subunit 4-like isoform X2 n=1 Tax=Orbicella faveolata TaxID=48498 RepID=UPI0009E52C89|nr:serine/threonine-protein phosphatase 4 regulatory subunit 4-like isoform X2 [Orbicella faveolata]